MKQVFFKITQVFSKIEQVNQKITQVNAKNTAALQQRYFLCSFKQLVLLILLGGDLLQTLLHHIVSSLG